MPKTKRKTEQKEPPVPYREHKRVLRALNVIQSQWQALLEENHKLRMELAARPATIKA